MEESKGIGEKTPRINSERSDLAAVYFGDHFDLNERTER